MYFEAVPVSSGELPVQDGLFVIKTRLGGQHQMFFKTEDKKWYWCPNPYSVCGDGFITHWLRPISLEERDKEVAGKAWEAGAQWQYENMSEVSNGNSPDKDQYLQSLNS